MRLACGSHGTVRIPRVRRVALNVSKAIVDRACHRTVRACHGIIVPTRNGSTIQRRYDVPDDKVAVIPLGLDDVFLSPDVGRVNSPNGVRLLYVGSYIALKGSDVLESVLPPLGMAYPHASITFVVPNEAHLVITSAGLGRVRQPPDRVAVARSPHDASGLRRARRPHLSIALRRLWPNVSGSHGLRRVCRRLRRGRSARRRAIRTGRVLLPDWRPQLYPGAHRAVSAGPRPRSRSRPAGTRHGAAILAGALGRKDRGILRAASPGPARVCPMFEGIEIRAGRSRPRPHHRAVARRSHRRVPSLAPAGHRRHRRWGLLGRPFRNVHLRWAEDFRASRDGGDVHFHCSTSSVVFASRAVSGLVRKALVRLRLADDPVPLITASGLAAAANPAAGTIRTGDSRAPPAVSVPASRRRFSVAARRPRRIRELPPDCRGARCPYMLAVTPFLESQRGRASHCPTRPLQPCRRSWPKASIWRSTGSRTRADTETTGPSCCRCPRPRSYGAGKSRRLFDQAPARAIGFVAPFNSYDPLTFSVLAERFPLICGGPESVACLGYRAGPSFLMGSLYVPSYRGAYCRPAEALALRSADGRGRRPHHSGDDALAQRGPRRLSRLSGALRATPRPCSPMA